MKKLHVKILAILSFFFAISFSMNAQENVQNNRTENDTIVYSPMDHRHEFSLGIGFSSLPNYNCSNWFLGWNDKELADFNRTLSHPIFNLRYNYRINKLLGIGATLSSDFEYFHSAMVDLRFHYITKEKFCFYGDVSLGVLMCNGNANNVNDKSQLNFLPNFGIYPIGLKFGKAGGAFIELGYGHKGIANFGGFIRF